MVDAVVLRGGGVGRVREARVQRRVRLLFVRMLATLTILVLDESFLLFEGGR